MKKTIKKSMTFVTMLLLTLILFACQTGNDVEIVAHTEQNLVHEYIMIKATEFEGAKYDWFIKEEGTDEWVLEKEAWTNKLYYSAHHQAKYDVKTEMFIKGNYQSSNVITIEFIENYGETFGMSPLGNRPSRNVDFTHDVLGDEKYIIHGSANKTQDEFAFFKAIYGTRYVISAQIDILGINGSDPFPKSGLVAAQFSDRLVYFAFDARPTFDYNDVIVVNRSGDDGGKWEWPGTLTTGIDIDFRRIEGQRTKHRLTVIRDLTTFYFLVDDQLVLTKQFPDLTFDTVAGTYTMAQSAIFSNYYAYMDDPDSSNDVYDQMLIEARGY
jgi:hypothetical protein